ncbi:Cellular tumor antigen p53, partial [Bienertia sinuspersici]
MSSKNNEALLECKEDDVESQNQMQEMNVGIGFEIGQITLNLKQLKSFEILKSALKIFTSNTNFMYSMILSILPLFVSTVLYELKLQNSISYFNTSNYPEEIEYISFELKAVNNKERNLLPVYDILELSGPFITYLCVHLLSSLTLLGLIWIVSNYNLFKGGSSYYDSTVSVLDILFITVHSVMFMGLLYKYLDWSSFWNMSMVICIISEEQTYIEVFEMSDYYGKHSKRTRFQLMLGFFVVGNVLRISCLYAGLCDESVGGVLITCSVMMFVSVGNLVKWVAFVLYFYYCKEKTMEKKVDDQELGKTHQVLLQPHDEQVKSKQNLDPNNHLKLFQILKSAAKNITSNTKLMFLMIISTLPFFIFMIFYEIIIIPKVIDDISNFLIPPSSSYSYNLFNGDEYELDTNDPMRKNFCLLLELFPFYLVLLPMLEIFSLPIIINVAAKMYAGIITQSSSSTLKQEITQVFYHKNNLKGYFITSIWVQLLSICILSGLFWTIISHQFIMYLFLDSGYTVEVLSFLFHAVIFVGVLYKYLELCSIWNMGMVICVLQKETGGYALEMSAYYGKHFRQTGFELMLSFLAYNVVLRLPFLVARMFSYVSVVGVDVVIVIVVGLVCLGSLVKWVAFVLYYYDCKVKVLFKKVDEE